jgi:RHH-type proline utilization regulon transcriptional repressor/proline dehydrogenase/delta 1-pyrroline-5-carboxylate dehydrogenase
MGAGELPVELPVPLSEEERAWLATEARRRGLAEAEAAALLLRRGIAFESSRPALFPDFAHSARGEEGGDALAAARAAIARAFRMAETEAVPALLADLPPDPPRQARAEALARRLVEALRAKGRRGGIEGLIHEFSLSSQEGVALMCLAEALLRIPDTATRDALIREKLAGGDWQAHLGHNPSLFVNAAIWGLMITGRLVGTHSERSLGAALTRLLGRGGEPLIRAGVDLAMRLLGEQFVAGRTIEEALSRARRFEARGFRYSYDMLGEAAMTEDDARRYFALYEEAIGAIGKAAAGQGPVRGPGISVKLSALHPRYTPFQEERAWAELFPRLLALAEQAKRFGLGLSIDAEEAERLELSLALFAALASHPALEGWEGLGFVVQAYQKRAPFVIDWLVALAERTGRRLPVRLVKGAYWDSEIKRAQVEGLDYPVFTRKIHTDVSYLACARRLFAAGPRLFPQFATHNALTVACLHEMAEGRDPATYEYQCLHGMGEPLYEEVLGTLKLGPACRIYAPVGSHETLLPYLVRRLLENGANTSFVHRLADPAVPVEALLADPVAEARALSPQGAPHPRLPPPEALYFPARRNSRGIDLPAVEERARLAPALSRALASFPEAAPSLGGGGPPRPVFNPADGRDVVGLVRYADAAAIGRAMAALAAGGGGWRAMPAAARAAVLEKAAARLEEDAPALIALIAREAGRIPLDAVGEIREAADALRYYAAEARALAASGGGEGGGAPLLAISPWNFPLAIFVGQVAAALAAGRSVAAKPAEETPLTAARAHRLLIEAGVPEEAFALLPGDGAVGAALVDRPEIAGVLFTGSTATARAIGARLLARNTPLPPLFVAETGGLNAMVVDSSALPEQVVADVLVSAFDSAGQRCSALRLLCVQEEVHARLRELLLGAMAELRTGRPDRLATDVGPLISAEARRRVARHIEAMRARGRRVHQAPLTEEAELGFFLPPTLIELESAAELEEEIFGPVLHLVSYRREALEGLIATLEAKGYALTFGIHSRLDETIEPLSRRAPAGNVYVNRSMIGAVIGVQPFGGHGRSGTGPKAGGPLLLRRLWPDEARLPPLAAPLSRPEPPTLLQAWLAHLASRVGAEERARHEQLARLTWAGLSRELPGPVGERNLYLLEGREEVGLLAGETEAARLALTVLLGMGSRVWLAGEEGKAFSASLPTALAARLRPLAEEALARLDLVLFDPGLSGLIEQRQDLFAHAGAVPVFIPLPPAGLAPEELLTRLVWVARERVISINTAAIGGNASLMTLA